MKLWGWIHRHSPLPFVSSWRAARYQATASAIKALPVARPSIREEITREIKKGSIPPSDVKGTDGKTCPTCGGKTKLKVLKYWCDPVTDIITPADTIDHCSCGWTGPIVEHERPL